MMFGVRAKIMQYLLENCTSVKVKQVFLYLSEKTNSRYLKKLNLNEINLGKGKRQIVIHNAKLNKKYMITVDENHDGEFL